MKGWIGVDLDGTLAEYHKWVAWNVIGKPIPRMLDRIKRYLDAGEEIKIFTARVAFEKDICYVTGENFTRDMVVSRIQLYCHTECIHGWRPEVTALKDFRMVKLYDDRCVQVIPNTGMIIEEMMDELKAAKLREADWLG